MPELEPSGDLGGLGEFLSTLPGQNPEPTPEPTPAQEPTATTEPTTEPTPNPEPTPAPSVEPTRQNQAFAAMRTENAKLQKQMETLLKLQGVESFEQLEQNQAAQALQQQAQDANLPPEVLQRINQLENSLAAQREAAQEQAFVDQMGSLVTQFNMDREAIIQFGQQADANGIDLRNSGLPLDKLYTALNYEKLVQAKIDEAKQSWLQEEVNKTNTAPTPNLNTGYTNPGTNLDSLFQGLNNL